MSIYSRIRAGEPRLEGLLRAEMRERLNDEAGKTGEGRPWDCVKVLVAVLLVFLTAGQAWAAFCWRDNFGGTVVMELGPAAGPFILVMGAYMATQNDPVCLGYRTYPFHGIAKIVGSVALLGFTGYSEGGTDCGTAIGEISIDLNTLQGTGYMRSAPHFDLSELTTFTPVACP